MRAIIVDAPGVKDNLRVGEAPEPIPGPGEALIDVAYCGCNFADTMIVSGTYPHPKGYPIIGGLEVSGRIAKLGPGVTGAQVGDRVAAFLEEAGGFADRCVARIERLIPIPGDMGLDVAAAFPIQALTAWHLLHNVSATKPGDVILIHAIGGGVGLFATQLAVRAGATVIGTVGTKGKEARALAYGATKVINRDDKDFVEAVMSFTQGRGVDKVLDSTGASILDRSFSADPQAWSCRELRRGGRPAFSQSLGEAGGEVAHLHPLPPRSRRLFFCSLAPIDRRSRGRDTGREPESAA